MLKRISALLVAGGAAVALVGTAGTASFATTATTWTVTPGGAITGAAKSPTLEDTTTGTTLTCKTSAAKGTAKSGSGLAGTGIASITSATFTTCTGPLSLTFTVKTNATASKPWKLNAVSEKSGVVTGTLTGIKATLSGTDCSASVAGTTASATGKVNGTYTNSTGVLKVSGGNLHLWNVSGCLGLVNSGDASTFTGSYTITPKQTITAS